MSTRHELQEWLAQTGATDHGVCAACGEPRWSGYWMGETEIRICRTCAVEILPRLIADAIWQPGLSLGRITGALDDIVREYWRAVALALLRERDRHAR